MAVLGIVVFMGSGCDSGEKIARLEKQVDELKAEQKNNQAVADFDSQAKCAKDSRTWFNENWSRDKDTVMLEFANHYNKAQNKCFIVVEFHFSTDNRDSWTNSMSIWDVYENAKYGTFMENHTTYFKPVFKIDKRVVTCELLDKTCKSLEEFNDLTRPYLNN
jgi:hypothetical protein